MAEAKVTTEKKPAAPKKAATPKAAAKPKATAEKKPAAAKKTTAKSKASTVDLEQQYRMIEVAAYYIAERDGFTGNPVDYWIAAEAQFSKK